MIETTLQAAVVLASFSIGLTLALAGLANLARDDMPLLSRGALCCAQFAGGGVALAAAFVLWQAHAY